MKGANWRRIGTLLSSTFLIGTILCFPVALMGQNETKSIRVNYTTDAIHLDGKLDEADWQKADKGDNFGQYFPSDTARSNYPTEFKLLYDDHYVYVGIRGVAASDQYVVSSLRRDFRGTTSDNVTVLFDTFKDGNTAFMFGMTPFGVQREAFISQGGTSAGFNPSWDQKWQLESKRYDGYFILEAAIPFSSLKFKEGENEWRMQCYRWDIGANEQSAWAHVPQNQMLLSLAFMHKMVFEKPLGKSRSPFTLIPYMNALASHDYIQDTPDKAIKFGGDAKISIGNSMNLDITVNPDFSNVEVDAIYTNLTRFEVFLPEKRQFFIDNSDLFGSFGSYGDALPFFSRRIGLARDEQGNLIENNILGGFRLSGNVNEKWRLGVLNVQTAADLQHGIVSNNHSMFAVQKMVLDRSSLGFFMINRQGFNPDAVLSDPSSYNRVMGIDYNLASANNKWMGKFYVHQSFQPDDNKGNLSAQAKLAYNTKKYGFSSDLVYLDKDFRSDLGFIPRTGFLKSENRAGLRLYPKSDVINRHLLEAQTTFYWDPYQNYRTSDYEVSGTWGVLFKNNSRLDVESTKRYVFLSRAFDPTRSGGIPLAQEMGYDFKQLSASFQSNLASLLTYRIASTTGQYFNGKVYTAGGEMAYRVQPWASFSLALNYTGIRLPQPHSSADFWLITPKADITFNKSLFWSTLVQYNKQRNNLGINSRLQWRFAPLSDLHLVYNDNYLTDTFGPRFRSINLKLTYWLNV